MRLRLSANVRLRLCASACVCVCVHLHASAHRKLNVRTHLDAKILRPDTSFVQGLSGCTIHVIVQCNLEIMYILSLVPRPEEGGGGEKAWFHPFVHVLNYLEFNHVLIIGGCQ